jgi:hypothetical protein
LTPAIKLSIVVGVQHAQSNLQDIVHVLRPAAHAEVEFLFCHADGDPDVATLIKSEGHVRVIRGAPGSLIPHLWRDGILAARGGRVATTTAHCIPTAAWVEALMAADVDAAAAGGTIENDPNADAKATAIFLLRYFAFAPPQANRDVRDLAADNAVYRRSDVMRYPNLLQRGFWEPSFHRRFLSTGIRLRIDPSLKVIHHNRYSAHQFVRQRIAHGREFGLTRASAQPFLQRLLLVLVSPAIFPVLVARILRTSRRNPTLRRLLVSAWFWLPVFILAWVVGEATGYLASLGYRQSSAPDL